MTDHQQAHDQTVDLAAHAQEAEALITHLRQRGIALAAELRRRDDRIADLEAQVAAHATAEQGQP